MRLGLVKLSFPKTNTNIYHGTDRRPSLFRP